MEAEVYELTECTFETVGIGAQRVVNSLRTRMKERSCCQPREVGEPLEGECHREAMARRLSVGRKVGKVRLGTHRAPAYTRRRRHRDQRLLPCRAQGRFPSKLFYVS